MASPFGISTGDIIAFISSAMAVFKGLQDNVGAASEYQGIVRELENIERSLKTVEGLQTEDGTARVALESVMFSCRDTLSGFLGKVQRYDSALRSGGSSKKLENVLLKVRWTLSTGKEIERFQGQLYGHAIALNIILSKIHGDISTRAHESQNTILRRIESKFDQQEADQDQERIDVLAVLSLLQAELRSLFAMFLLIGLNVCQSVIGFGKVPRQIEFEAPTVFEDAHGRLFPLNHQWIDKWEDFEEVLNRKFVDMPGLAKVKDREYTLHDVHASREITKSEPFSRAFRPGRRIRMTMIFFEAANIQHHGQLYSNFFECLHGLRFLRKQLVDDLDEEDEAQNFHLVRRFWNTVNDSPSDKADYANVRVVDLVTAQFSLLGSILGLEIVDLILFTALPFLVSLEESLEPTMAEEMAID